LEKSQFYALHFELAEDNIVIFSLEMQRKNMKVSMSFHKENA
jgi:hypothetical protein